MITDLTDIKRSREYYEQLSANKFDKLVEADKALERHKLPTKCRPKLQSFKLSYHQSLDLLKCLALLF